MVTLGGNCDSNCHRFLDISIWCWGSSVECSNGACHTVHKGQLTKFNDEEILISHQLLTIFEVLNPPVIALTKLSICLQFIRLFVPLHSAKYWSIQAFIWINMLYFVSCFFITLFQCIPREKIWDPLVPGTCVHYQWYIVITGIFNCVSDFLMFMFPMFCIWKLQMPPRRKIGISGIFLVGVL